MGYWLKRIFVFCVLISLGVSIGFNLLIRSRIAQKDFKEILEREVGRYLNAEISVERVSVGFFNKISLHGIRARSSVKENDPFQIQVEKLEFRFNLKHLLKRNFVLPATIRLKDPKLVVRSGQFPYDFVRAMLPDSPGRHLESLELSDGEFEFFLPVFNKPVIFQNIHGSLSSLSSGMAQVDLRASTKGVISGTIIIRGQIDTIHKTHYLTLHIGSFYITDPISIPVAGATGKISWDNDRFLFDHVATEVKGWKILAEGSMTDLAKQPTIDLRAVLKNEEQMFQFNFLADFKKGVLQAALEEPSVFKNSLKGEMKLDQGKIFLDRLMLNDLYEGNGSLDFRTGNLAFDFFQDRQEISFQSNLSAPEAFMKVDLDHFNFLGLDLVTKGQLKWEPVAFWERDSPWKLRAHYESDLFILEFMPLDDFKADFELSSKGISNISAKWGEKFSLDGVVQGTLERSDADITLQVKGFDLANAQEFAARPLPKQLSGILEGKMQLKGNLMRPEITGIFNVKDGSIGKLMYDKGIVKFRGFPPYLALNDSKIMRGRSRFNLEGVIDLSLRNIFHGIQVKTSDKFVVWKGGELNLKDRDLEIVPSFYGIPTMSIKEGKVERTQQPVGSETDTVQEQSYFGIGPKFKF